MLKQINGVKLYRCSFVFIFALILTTSVSSVISLNADQSEHSDNFVLNKNTSSITSPDGFSELGVTDPISTVFEDGIWDWKAILRNDKTIQSNNKRV